MSLADCRSLTRRQLAMMHDQALIQQQNNRADRLDDFSLALTGKPSAYAEQLRNAPK